MVPFSFLSLSLTLAVQLMQVLSAKTKPVLYMTWELLASGWRNANPVHDSNGSRSSTCSKSRGTRNFYFVVKRRRNERTGRDRQLVEHASEATREEIR